jgi:hypothetical protein
MSLLSRRSFLAANLAAAAISPTLGAAQESDPATLTLAALDIPAAGSVVDIWNPEIYAYHEPWITTSPELYQEPTRRLIEAAEATSAAVYADARAAFNIYGLPTISVPCGFTEGGLSIGLQISGAHFDEARVVALAHAYEQATEWHRRRPNLTI